MTIVKWLNMSMQKWINIVNDGGIVFLNGLIQFKLKIRDEVSRCVKKE